MTEELRGKVAVVTGGATGIGAAVSRAFARCGGRMVIHRHTAAGAFLYLASDRLSGYVTGQILEVSGGQLMP